MIQKKPRTDWGTLLVIPFSLLLMLNTMSRTAFEISKSIGDLSINLTLFFMYVFLIKTILYKETLVVNTERLHLVVFSLIVLNCVSFFTNSNVDMIYLLKVLLLLLFILGAIRIKWTPRRIKAFAYITLVFSTFIFIHWIQLGFPDYRFKSIFRNPNYLAVLLFSMLYFQTLAVKFGRKFERIYFSIAILLNLVLIYHTNSRTVLICIAIISVVWIALKVVPKLFPYLIYITLFSNLFFLFIYIKIQHTPIGLYLDDSSKAMFGKSFYSGRSPLWDEILQKIFEQPFFGYGLGTTAKDITTFNLTAHNQYLQSLIEVGIIGFSLLLLLFISIWKLLINRIESFPAQLSACFFIGILVYENFELTLFQNNYSFFLYKSFNDIDTSNPAYL